MKRRHWLEPSKLPSEENSPFLVLLAGNDAADFLILQVSVFEGRMYPDHLDCNIDHSDAINPARVLGWRYPHHTTRAYAKRNLPPANS